MEGPTCCRYGGVILESNYKDVPFGEPAAVIRLGSTLRLQSGSFGGGMWIYLIYFFIFILFFMGIWMVK